MVRRGKKDISGILLVNKPEGMTSAAVVGKIKRHFGLYKVGHAGTLDPIATGLLPICINEATKLAGFMSNSGKQYQTTMKLGEETDTQDRTGEIVSTKPVTVAEDKIKQELESFKGSYSQLPPMFSAKKKDGQPLYKSARQGKDIKREPVEVQVFDLHVDSISLPEVQVSMKVSKGFYVRTLCHDLGKKLGCGANMAELVRTAHGQFELENAYDLADILTFDEITLQEKLIALSSPLIEIPSINVGEKMARAISFGNQIPLNMAKSGHKLLPDNSPILWRAIDEDGNLIALLKLKIPVEKWNEHSSNEIVWSIDRGFVV